MRLRGDDERVSTLAPVAESEQDEIVDAELSEVSTNGGAPEAAEVADGEAEPDEDI
jgi:hypothetical protein